MEEEEIHLPENIIQHIQSFLTTKEAARTCLISKPWYSSWLNRPSLQFNQHDFAAFGDGFFLDLVRTSLQRYQQCNLNLHRFDLFMHSGSLATDEFVTHALRLGVSDLAISVERSNYVIPLQVFAALYLTKLSLVRCKIEGISLLQVKCSRLKLLSLYSVSIDDEAMNVILMGCSSIEDLYLCGCKGLSRVDISKMHSLKKVHVDHFNTTIEPLSVVFQDSNTMPDFCLLTSLVLRNVSVGDAFFHQFMLKFPCLEYLMLDAPSDPFEHVRIASHSLKFLGLRYCWRLKKAELDVPNIRKFEYVGVRSSIPSLSINTDAEDLECQITFISYHFEAMKLREFLKVLSCSRISLCLQQCSAGSVIPVGHAQDSPIPVVEDLMIRGQRLPLSSAFLSAVFLNCHPELITQEFDAFRDLQCLYDTLKQQVNQKYPTSPDKSLPIHHLVDFNIEFFDEMKWQPISWEAVLDAWNVGNGSRFRFQLLWSIQ